MRSSAFQIRVYYKEYNQNIKIFNTNKYSQENVIKNIYIYQHSRRVPDRLKPWPMKIRNQKISNKVYGGGPSERVSSKAPPLLWNYLNGTMWKWEEHLKYVLLINKKKIQMDKWTFESYVLSTSNNNSIKQENLS